MCRGACSWQCPWAGEAGGLHWESCAWGRDSLPPVCVSRKGFLSSLHTPPVLTIRDTPAALRASQGSCLPQMWPRVHLPMEPAVPCAPWLPHAHVPCAPGCPMPMWPGTQQCPVPPGCGPSCSDGCARALLRGQEQLWRLSTQTCAAQPWAGRAQHSPDRALH